MAVATQPRTGLPNWGSGNDPSLHRVDANAITGYLENSVPIELTGTLGARPAYGKNARYYFANDTGQLFRDNGSAWVELPTFANGGVFTKPLSSIGDTAPQVRLDNASNAADVALELHRKTNAGGTTERRAVMRVTSNRAMLSFEDSTVSGVTTDFTGIAGRWALNWGQDFAPSELLIIKSRSGVEVARFTEAGYLGIGLTAPLRPLDVKSAMGMPAARFGGGTTSSSYSAVVTPDGPATMVLASGGEYFSGSFTARNPAGGYYRQADGAHQFYGNATGLSSGGAYTLNQLLALGADGALSLPMAGAKVAIGSASTPYPLYVLGDNPTFQGNASAVRFMDVGGTFRGAMGLRSDIAGNAGDLVLYSTGGNFRWFAGAVERLRVPATGAVALNVAGEIRFGAGSLSNAGLWGQMFDDGANTISILGRKNAVGVDSAMNIYLSALGAGSTMHLRPEDIDTVVLNRAGGVGYANVAGYTTMGSAGPTQTVPGVQIRRVYADAPSNSAVQMSIPHGLDPVSATRRILFVDAWYRGNSSEASKVTLSIAAVDASYVYVNIPAGIGNHTVWATILFADSDIGAWH